MRNLKALVKSIDGMEILCLLLSLFPAVALFLCGVELLNSTIKPVIPAAQFFGFGVVCASPSLFVIYQIKEDYKRNK